MNSPKTCYIIVTQKEDTVLCQGQCQGGSHGSHC